MINFFDIVGSFFQFEKYAEKVNSKIKQNPKLNIIKLIFVHILYIYTLKSIVFCFIEI